MGIIRQAAFRQGYQPSRRGHHLHEKLNMMSWEGAVHKNPQFALLGYFLNLRDSKMSNYESTVTKKGKSKQTEDMLEDLRIHARIVASLKVGIAKSMKDSTPRDVDAIVRPVAAFATSPEEVAMLFQVLDSTDEFKAARKLFNSV